MGPRCLSRCWCDVGFAVLRRPKLPRTTASAERSRTRGASSGATSTRRNLAEAERASEGIDLLDQNGIPLK
jgi:hypothetical protein